MAKAFKKLPAPRVLRQLFEYDRDTKVLRKKLAPRSAFASHQAWGIHNAKAGQPINGAPSEKYARVCINFSRFSVHRIIFKMVTGREPPPNLDHINRDSHDNSWANLRRCTTSQNGANRRANVGQTTKGIHFNKGKWTARIQVRGKRLYLGRFSTKEAAYEAYCSQGIKSFGEFFHPG